MVAVEQIEKKGYFNQTLRLIARVACWADIVNLNTAYLMLNS